MEPTDDYLSAELSLSEDDTLAYAYVANTRRADPHDLAVHVGTTPAIAHQLIDRLIRLGLVQSDTGSGLATVVYPEVAAERMLGEAARETRRRLHRIDEIRAEYAACLPYYSADDSWEMVLPPSEVQIFVDKELGRATDEVLTIQPGGARPSATLNQVLDLELTALKRGVRRRVLYQHTARKNMSTQAFVQRIARSGAEVRTVNTLPDRMIIIDRRLCIVPSRPSDNGTPAGVVIRKQQLMTFICDLFERFWEAGIPFNSDAGEDKIIDETKRSILQALVTGATDEIAARRLGMSTRTFRRHLAAVMTELGASSRFQVAVAAIQSGLVDAP
ncbi:helix-turn-helix transcriptional regulator [Actinoplanes sichuanensis]|nr:helix-turn-helix transcriptional regulator [Actinoplanes sichuanensis]